MKREGQRERVSCGSDAIVEQYDEVIATPPGTGTVAVIVHYRKVRDGFNCLVGLGALDCTAEQRAEIKRVARKRTADLDRAFGTSKGQYHGAPPPPRPPLVVCLCGSTRFWREFQRASLRETMRGRIVLSIGAATGTDDEHFGNLPPEEYLAVKERLDELHLRKIDMADEILVLNCEGYVGESTQREIDYARSLSKPIRWLEPKHAATLALLDAGAKP